MADKKTLYGIVEVSEEGKVVHSDTFRLHLGNGVHGIELISRDGFPDFTKHYTVVVYLDLSPSAGMIYERELHIGLEKSHKNGPVFHLKEGRRFFECSIDTNSFAFSLAHFLLANTEYRWQRPRE